MLHAKRAERRIQCYPPCPTCLPIAEDDGIWIVLWVRADAYSPGLKRTMTLGAPFRLGRTPLDALRNHKSCVGEARQLGVALLDHETLGAAGRESIGKLGGVARNGTAAQGIRSVSRSARLSGGRGD